MVQFVPLKVDTVGEAWQKWAGKYKHEGDGIPIIYVIRGDGQMMYGKTGSMAGPALRQFMAAQIAQAGRILSDKEATALTEALEGAKKALDQGDTAAALEAIGAVKRIGPPGKIGSYAKAAVEADQFVAKLVADGKAAIAEARQKVSGGDASLESALILVEARRLYSSFPELKTELIGVFRELNKDETARDVIKQAELLDRARSYLSARGGESRAASALRQIVARYPDSAVAELAKAELAKLPEDTVASRPAGPSTTTRPAGPGPSTALSPSAARKKAASSLRMARIFAQSRPDKAKKYAQEVIDLLPDSNEAREAKAILKRLE